MSLLMSVMTPVEFLILDEHTAALDPKTADVIMQLTDRIIKREKTYCGYGNPQSQVCGTVWKPSGNDASGKSCYGYQGRRKKEDKDRGYS